MKNSPSGYAVRDIDLFYTDNVDDLFRYARSMGLEKNTATDLIHDIFCRIYASPGKLNNVENIKFYLFRALKNRVTDMYRSRREEWIENQSTGESIPFQISISIEDELINSEEQKQIEEKVSRILATLTNRQREIIYLRYIHEYSYEEIAKLMNISVPACHKLMSSALSRMRQNSDYILIVLVLLWLKYGSAPKELF